EAPKPPIKRYKALANGQTVRMCQNHTDFGACNWAVDDDDPEPLCLACRLNDVIPNQSKPELREAWLQLEGAKRRLMYTLYQLKLPVEGREEGKEGGLSFAFMAGEKEQPVFTGHSDGLITINVAEGNDPFREKMRTQLGEAYRTVLGHFRHEIGHYYWDRLIKDSDWLPKFRALFGDETLDYAQALERHYKEGAPADWSERFVSQYASMHPWEDWAETWAHYLHIFDTLDTAKSYGLRVKIGKGTGKGETVVDAEKVHVDDFDEMAEDWVPLTLALNSLNRSMGLRDVYPFVLTEAALNKLRFVHQVIRAPTPARTLQKPNEKAQPKPAQPAVEARQLAHFPDLTAAAVEVHSA
ncbi:MAG TPA: putative zinc-binding metallopeptidase, partial [Polyangiales bacterium]